ncbi:arylsulfatase [Haliea sp. E1-2-M8]|uniref:arylsulfatase n=1 Tax=Haliea sp. E1-2-M8 TaxID=3064706 RepID=UPI00271886ED|nr:arylsulfatase [Haliea sp. E1-2-M8]MDO8863944.1 arylsulfatase [Haliea sp. E1-2-M8]
MLLAHESCICKPCTGFDAMTAMLALMKTIGGIHLAALFAGIVWSSGATASTAGATTIDQHNRPNILLIVIDDLGYTDLGSFGGEIRTPNIDNLARRGTRFTNFYVSPNCAPTRSMLLSGLDHHVSGHGTMLEHIAPNQRGKPGYEGYLNERVRPLAEVVKDAGYNTYMLGKWHLGLTEEKSPAASGFEKSFALLLGGGSHFSDKMGLTSKFPEALYREDGVLVEELPDGFYSTDFYTDEAISYLSNHRDPDKPFFMYLAYTAPHWPLQVPDHALDLYQGVYDEGYEELRELRIRKARQLGILSGPSTTSLRPPVVPQWDSLAEDLRKTQARRMEIYASMVDLVDRNVGRVLAYVERIGELDNTIVLVMSDNGAEGNRRFTIGGDDWVERNFDHSYEAMGRRGSYVYLGPGWAQASMGPFRLWKAHTTEGGIRAPLVIAGPGVSSPGSIEQSVTTVRDLYPTLLDVAETKVLPSSAGHVGNGTSLLPLLAGRSDRIREVDEILGWEIFGGRAIRAGDWKLTRVAGPNGSDQWELFNVHLDPGETQDLADSNPERFAHMLELWESYAEQNGVVLPEGKVHGAWGDVD